MKLSENFCSEEFLPKDLHDLCMQKGWSPKWFINPDLVRLAEFYKIRFMDFFKDQGYDVKKVVIKVNDWKWNGGTQFRGLRPITCKIGAKFSQHRLANGFDCDVIGVTPEGTRVEANYRDLVDWIKEREDEFYEVGLRCLEDPRIAKSWLHSDLRWTDMDGKILIVGA